MARKSSEMARNSSEMARRSFKHVYIKNIDWISNKTYIIMIYIFNIAFTKTVSMQIGLMLKMILCLSSQCCSYKSSIIIFFLFFLRGRPKTEGTGAKPLIFPPP